MNTVKTYAEKASCWINRSIKGDKVVWIIVFLLSMFSLAAVYSASSYRAMHSDVNKIVIFLDQLVFVLAGWAALLVCYFIHPKYYRKFSFLVYGISIVLLLLLFVDPLTARQNGAIRGLKLPGFTFQVFEVAKAAIIIYLARAMEIFEIKKFKDYLLKLLLPIALTCVLLLRGSFSSAVFTAMICLVILWINKINWRYLALTIAGGIAVLGICYGLYKLTENNEQPLFERFETAESRIDSFLHPADEEVAIKMTEEEKQAAIDAERQSENAKIAIHEGGIIGKGPGKSTQRYTLSMAFSDFIYAFIIEEYGSIVGIFVMFLYIWLFARCARLAAKCKTTFAGTTVFGLGLLTTFQALMHIYVNIRMIPITGHTLPLVSHGGTAFIIFSGIFGVILSVSKSIQEIDLSKVDPEPAITEKGEKNESDN
jgi:cell division protein FtsW